MGNTSKKLAAKCTFLTKDEQKYLAATFRSANKNNDKLREDEIIVSGTVDAESLEPPPTEAQKSGHYLQATSLYQRLWGPQIDPRLAQYLSNFLFGPTHQRSQTADFTRFAELYVFNVRGSVDERMMLTYNSLGKPYSESTELPYQLLKEYCESIASTYIKIVKTSSAKRPRTWIDKGFRGRALCVQALGEALAASISADMDSPQTHCNSTELSRWLMSNTLLRALTESVFENLYGVERRDEEELAAEGGTNMPSLIPKAEGIDSFPDYPAFTDLSHIVWLNSHLPVQHQHKWRFLFSSHIHGESFSTMAGRIQDQGPSVIIIEDNNGYIFGGFAAQSWNMGPNFYGTEEGFLFTVAPKMRIYPGTTFNNHYQYMNVQTKTMPNGLMMGGQFEYGGIWVTADPFGEGSSAESCSTYRGYRRLSKEQTFHIRSLEVWGVGDKPLSMRDSDERDVSVLDTNPEAKAILELAGRARHSEGLREPQQ